MIKWIGVATLVPLLTLAAVHPVAASPTTGEIEQLKSFVEQNPNSLREQYKLGALYFLSKRFDEAIDIWSKILANKSLGLKADSKVKIAKGLALAHFKIQKVDKAFKYIRWVYRHNPDDPKVSKAYTVIKKAYDDQYGQNKIPVQAVLAVTDKPPADAPPSPASAAPPPKPKPSRDVAKKNFIEGEQLYQEGRIAIEQVNPDYEKKFGQVIEHMQVAVDGEYNLARAQFYLGSAYLFRNKEDSDDLKLGKEHLEESLKADTDKWTLFNLAQVYGLLDDKDKEIENYEKALDLDQKWAECHFRLALAYDKSKRQDAARKTFEHAKAAIREKSEYKKKFQEVLKNSDVAKQIASIVSEIIEKSENDQLTDAETEKYAQKFQQMLGEKNLTTNDLKDKGKLKDLMNSDDAKKMMSGEDGEKFKKFLSSGAGKKLQERVLNKVKEQQGEAPSGN